MEDEFMSITEVSTMLRINRATIYNMAKDGRLNFKKIGKLWRIKREDVTSIFKKSEASEQV